jgi:tRNA(Ser,Leu) C12 N-acetylase TAN1
LKIIITSPQNKEDRAVEEVLSLIFQKDENAKILIKAIKPGLSLIESNVTKEDLASILKNLNRTYFIKVIPIDIETKDYKEAIKNWISENIQNLRNKSFAVRCTSRFGISGTFIEKEVGAILNSYGIKINLKNPDYIIIIQPIYDRFFISFLNSKSYLIFLSRRKI